MPGDGHTHGHRHGPVAGAEGGWEPSGPGTVLLDIDETMGALVVAMPPAALGREIEVEPAGAAGVKGGALVHTAVRERPLPGGVVYAAFFPSLAPGRYRMRLRGEGTGALGEAEVGGGRVAEVDLS